MSPDIAGPGEYARGEQGSPLIAIESLRGHKDAGRLRNVEIVFLFAEEVDERAVHLQETLENQPPVPGTTFHVFPGKFEDHMTSLLNQIDAQNKVLAPAFVMIDPFGVKGCTMELIGRVVRNPRSECLISFMYEPIRRWHRHRGFKTNLDAFFGTKEWRDGMKIDAEEERKVFFHDLFEQQLRSNGAKYVITFEMYRGNRHVYTLYFTTGNLKGCDLMKSCIWKLDPTGTFRFRSRAVGLIPLFGPETDRLARQLSEQFGAEWTSIDQVEEFVMGDSTPFHKGHLRQKTLQPLERKGQIEVHRPQGVRGLPTGKGVRIRFK